MESTSNNLIIKQIDTVRRGINIILTNNEIYQLRPPKNHHCSNSSYGYDEYLDNNDNFEVEFYNNILTTTDNLIGKSIQNITKKSDYCYNFVIDNINYDVKIVELDHNSSSLAFEFENEFSANEADIILDPSRIDCPIFLIKKNSNSKSKFRNK